MATTNITLNGKNFKVSMYKGVWGYIKDWDAYKYRHRFVISNGVTSTSFTYNDNNQISSKDDLIVALDCIFSDMDCTDFSFEEFCKELGYDSYDGKSMRIYKAILGQREQLAKVGITNEERMNFYDIYRS